MTTFILPQNDCANVDTCKFEGSSFYNIVGMYYLSHKLPNLCVVTGKPYEFDSTIKTNESHNHDASCVKLPSNLNEIPPSQIGVSLRWIEKDQRISVPEPQEEFWKYFLGCGKKDFASVTFGFTCKSFGHANNLLMDFKSNTLERFESFGIVKDHCLADKGIDKKIEDLFRTNLRRYAPKYANFTYLKPKDIFPKNNIQTLQENEDRWKERDVNNNPVGFCSVWSIWYIELRVSNPKIKPKKLIELAIDAIMETEERRGNGSITDFIRRYSLLIIEEKNKIQQAYENDGSFGELFPDMFDGRRKTLLKGFCSSCEKTKTNKSRNNFKIKSKRKLKFGSRKKLNSLRQLFKSLKKSQSKIKKIKN